MPARSGSGPRIRGPRPSVAAQPDLRELPVVDPASYALGRELARGGMGRIWLARDRRLGRDVALKEVLVARGPAVRRFEREARITARLQHPSIVGVHEAGVWPSGEPFYAMPLVSGRSLADAIAQAPGFAERLALLPSVLAVADAMAYAHGQRVIHRDLKPRNVVVGEFGETVVLDWGLAKQLDAPADGLESAVEAPPADTSDPDATTAGDVLGTPAYMPPEQAAGAPVDERADVYAIGAMLYHVLAGAPPYAGTAHGDVLAAALREPPRPVTSLAPGVAPELVAILDRAMAREPAARYPTARELADDLRRFQTGQLVGAHRYSTGQLLRRWLRRHRTAIAALAAALVVAASIGGLALRRVVAAERLAQQQRAAALANRKSAEQLVAFMMGDLARKLASVGRLDLLDAVASRAEAYYDARGGADSEDDLASLVKAHQQLAKVRAEQGDLAAAIAQYRQTVALYARLSALHPEVATYGGQAALARLSIEVLEREQGHAADADAILHATVADADRLVAAHPHDLDALYAASAAHLRLAAVLGDAGDGAGSIAECRRALATATTLAALPDSGPGAQRLLQDTHSELGDKLLKTDPHAAVAELRAALAIAANESARDPEDAPGLADLAVAHEELGSALADQGDLDGALAEDRAGVEINDRLVRLDPSNVEWQHRAVRLHAQIGAALQARHDDAGALAELRTCAQLWATLLARTPSELDVVDGAAVTDDAIGRLEEAGGDLPAAAASYRQAVALRRQLVAKDPTNAAWQHALRESTSHLAAVDLRRQRAPGVR